MHGWYYPPVNPDFAAPEGERPPLFTLSHGGPTSQARAVLTLATQFWTTRGYAVLDVNYGGSTGYGRPYRERLKPRWGIVDVADCSNGALPWSTRGSPTGPGSWSRVAARAATPRCARSPRPTSSPPGSASSGSPTLRTSRGTPTSSSRATSTASSGLTRPTGDVYVERSPIHHVDQLSAPILLLQGLDDLVVPPNQAETMADAARANGLPVALILFDGEGHGFRRADTIVASYSAQVSFLGQVFGLTPADDVPVLAVENLP